MSKIKHTFSFILMLGMAAGSTAAYAQATDEVGGRTDGTAVTEEVAPGVNTGAAATAPIIPADEEVGGRADGSAVEDAAGTTLGMSDELDGMRVYGSDGNEAGVIARLSPADAMGDERVLIGSGGTGGRYVEIPVSDLLIERDAQGAIVRVSTSYTPAELEALPQVEM